MKKIFVYRARDSAGRIKSGAVAAAEARAAAAYLRERGYLVIRLKEKTAEWRLSGLWGRRRIGEQALAVFCRQLATLLDAGVSMTSALRLLAARAQPPLLQKSVAEVIGAVEQGEMLSRALQDCGAFPHIMAQMAAAGEAGGALDQVLHRLAEYFAKRERLRRRLTTAFFYPAAVLCTAVAVTGLTLTMVLPSFQALYAGMGVDLPLPTRLLLGGAAWTKSYGLYLPPALAGLAVGARRLCRAPRCRLAGERAAFVLPMVGPLLRRAVAVRFSRMLALLLEGGVPLVTALEIVKNNLGSLWGARGLAKAQAAVGQGGSLAGALRQARLLPDMALQMVAVGEASGRLDEMLHKIAAFYEAELDDAAVRLGRIAEPILVGALGLITGGIALSVALPMFDAAAGLAQFK